jgi:hypothetical protein
MSEGKGSPLVVAFASMPPSSFLFLSMCCRVNPLNYFSRFCNVDRYCARIGSFDAQSFSICPVIVLESVFTSFGVRLYYASIYAEDSEIVES